MIPRLRSAAALISAHLRRRDVLFGLAMLAAVWAAMPALYEAITPPDFSRGWRKDCDIALMHKSLLEHPRFRDTFEWWTGTWVGVVPFWRPLSSLLFWAEWRLFGWHNQDAWMLVHALSWLAVCALLFFLAEQALASPTAAAATVIAYALSGPGTTSYQLWCTTGTIATHEWKNSVDLWLTALLLASAIYAWRDRWLPAVALAALSCTIKETGFAGLALVSAIAAIRRQWLAAALGAAALSVFAAAKLHFVGFGFVMGTNRSLGTRMLRTLLPYPVAALLLPIRPFAILGFALAAAALLPRRLRWPIAAAIAFAAVLAVRYDAARLGWSISLPESALLFFDWRILTVTLPVAAWIIAAFWGMSWPTAIAAAAWWVLAFPTTLAPQVRPHALAPANAFGALAIISAWLHTFRRLSGRIKKQRPTGLPAALSPTRPRQTHSDADYQ